MAKVRREDREMKVPALLHLSRLGYGYLSRVQLRLRDRKTNIFPETLRVAVERINGIRMTAEAFSRLMGELQARLDAEDLGKGFYEMLRNGWNGKRLIDFEHPGNNCFQSAAELVCGRGAGSFRPDITLFVNGLPLAMIEVKTRDRVRGLRAEYDRMLDRLAGQETRRFLQCAQIWAFSDDHPEDPERLLPLEGISYAAVMASDFPVYAVRGKRTPGTGLLLPRNPEEERRILVDNGIPEPPRTLNFRRSLSPKKATHRMLTALFQPERFLFRLRYGIQYLWETDLPGKVFLTRRMLTAGQLAMLESLIGKAKRGYRNWTVPACGASGEAAANTSMITLLRDLLPGAELYWISSDEAALRQDREAFLSCGVPCAVGAQEARQEDGVTEPADVDRLVLMTADEVREVLSAFGEMEQADGKPSIRRVLILPRPVFQYGRKNVLPARLRKTDPEAVLVTRATNRMPENAFPAVVLRLEVKEAPERKAFR